MKKYSIALVGYGTSTLIADSFQVRDGSFYFIKNTAGVFNIVTAVFPINRTAILSIDETHSDEK